MSNVQVSDIVQYFPVGVATPEAAIVTAVLAEGKVNLAVLGGNEGVRTAAVVSLDAKGTPGKSEFCRPKPAEAKTKAKPAEAKTKAKPAEAKTKAKPAEAKTE